MNKVSFLDELVKMGGVTGALKVAQGFSDPPAGMIPDDGPVPDEKVHRPEDPSTRVSNRGAVPSRVPSGHLGSITSVGESVAEQGKIPLYRNS